MELCCVGEYSLYIMLSSPDGHPGFNQRIYMSFDQRDRFRSRAVRFPHAFSKY